RADHRIEVRLAAIERQPAQRIVRAELDDHDIGTMLREQARQASAPARGGFAADAGIDEMRAVAGLPREPADPAGAPGDAVLRRYAVAQHEHLQWPGRSRDASAAGGRGDERRHAEQEAAAQRLR